MLVTTQSSLATARYKFEFHPLACFQLVAIEDRQSDYICETIRNNPVDFEDPEGLFHLILRL